MSRLDIENILENLRADSSGLLQNVYCCLLGNLKKSRRTIKSLNDLQFIDGFTKPILDDIKSEQEKMKEITPPPVSPPTI